MSLISIAIKLILVSLGRSFKKAGSVLFVIGDSWDKDFLNPNYISLYLHTWVVLWLCVVFTIGERILLNSLLSQ